MRVLTTFFLALAPFAANADYICTYKNWYFLEDDGSMRQTTKGIQIGERFTVTNNGKTGEVEWRSTTLKSFYSVKGTQLCPGEMCPWTKENDKHVLTEQWKDKTVWDLIDEYDL